MSTTSGVSLVSLLAAFALLLSSAIGGCGDDKPGSAPELGTASSSGSVGLGEAGTIFTPDAAGGVGDGASQDGAVDVCAPATQQGLETEEWSQPQDPPAAYGGPITEGTYTLVALDSFIGPQPPPPGGESAIAKKTGKAKRATLVVTSTTLRFVEAAGQTGALSSDATRAFTYTADDAGTGTITATPACPAGGNAITMKFNASERSLQLFVTASEREQYDLVF